MLRDARAMPVWKRGANAALAPWVLRYYAATWSAIGTLAPWGECRS
jgi:hypothetical protein